MEHYVKKMAHIEACHQWLRQSKILYEPTYEDERFFDACEAFKRNSKVEPEPVEVDNANIKEYVDNLNELLNMTYHMIVDEIKNKTYFNGATFAFERLAKALVRYMDVVIGQTMSIDGYLALLLELRKMGKKLMSKGKIEDAMNMASVNEMLEDIKGIVSKLRKAKIKPAESLPFEIPKATFDNFDMLCSRANCNYKWLTNHHNCKESWWLVINNV